MFPFVILKKHKVSRATRFTFVPVVSSCMASIVRSDGDGTGSGCDAGNCCRRLIKLYPVQQNPETFCSSISGVVRICQVISMDRQKYFILDLPVVSFWFSVSQESLRRQILHALSVLSCYSNHPAVRAFGCWIILRSKGPLPYCNKLSRGKMEVAILISLKATMWNDAPPLKPFTQPTQIGLFFSLIAVLKTTQTHIAHQVIDSLRKLQGCYQSANNCLLRTVQIARPRERYYHPNM